MRSRLAFMAVLSFALTLLVVGSAQRLLAQATAPCKYNCVNGPAFTCPAVAAVAWGVGSACPGNCLCNSAGCGAGPFVEKRCQLNKNGNIIDCIAVWTPCQGSYLLRDCPSPFPYTNCYCPAGPTNTIACPGRWQSGCQQAAG
jgi:hypothetical protein